MADKPKPGAAGVVKATGTLTVDKSNEKPKE